MRDSSVTILRIRTYLLMALILMVSTGLITACGGGGGGGGTTSSTGSTAPGTSTAGLSSGEIEDFGSIIMNGITFKTDSAEFEIEGREDETISQDDFRKGMIVEIEGSFNDDGSTGTATRVKFEDTLEGPIDSIQETSPGLVKVLTILGHSVIVENNLTKFDDTPLVTFANLQVNQVMEVSGHMGVNGEIQATFIEKKAETLASWQAAGNLFEIKGLVSNLDNASLTFNINGLIIDFFDVTPRDGTLANGAMVEVKGNNLFAGILTATDVELKAGLPDDLGQAEVEGLIASLDSVNQTFMVNGQRVDYSKAVVLGGTLDDFANGIKVEAEGQVVGGKLMAQKVKFRASVRFEGNVADVDILARTLQLENLPGVLIQIDTILSEVKDNINLATLEGTEIKVRGRKSGNRVLAIRLEQVDEEPANRIVVQGPVTAFDKAGDSVTIIDLIKVDTSTISEVDDSGSNFEIEDSPVSRDAFFDALDVGDIVKARADINNSSLTWDQIEIELED